MNKVLTVIRKEYLERVRSKSFLVGTLLGPALMSMFIVLPVLLADKGGENERRVGVVDPSGLYFDQTPLWASRNVGIPLSADIPAPDSTMTQLASASRSSR